MVKIENHLGVIEISGEYFSNLVGRAASDCFGVAGMSTSNSVEGFKAIFRGKKAKLDKGVRVRSSGGGLDIELHIIVMFGVNISAIVKSIIHKVRYSVEEATGLTVNKVNVFVDGMKAQ